MQYIDSVHSTHSQAKKRAKELKCFNVHAQAIWHKPSEGYKHVVFIPNIFLGEYLLAYPMKQDKCNYFQ